MAELHGGTENRDAMPRFPTGDARFQACWDGSKLATPQPMQRRKLRNVSTAIVLGLPLALACSKKTQSSDVASPDAEEAEQGKQQSAEESADELAPLDTTGTTAPTYEPDEANGAEDPIPAAPPADPDSLSP